MRLSGKTVSEAVRFGWWTVVFGVVISAGGGCAGGPQNVLVSLPAYESPGVPAGPGASVRIEPVRDARSDAVGSLIGERVTLGVPMGMIEMKPIPTELMTQMLATELTKMGGKVVSAGEEVRVAARLTKFQVVTPATALYWDINGSIDLDLSASAQGGRKHDAGYAATCTDRTYVFPSEEIIRNVVSACVREIGARVRTDTALANFLRVR